MSDVKTAIMDAAERRMQLGGFGGFSFREIAADVGIKSSSVHSNALKPDTSPPDEDGPEERGEQKEPLRICLRGPTVGAVPRIWEEEETDRGDRETPDPHDREYKLHDKCLS